MNGNQTKKFYEVIFYFFYLLCDCCGGNLKFNTNHYLKLLAVVRLISLLEDAREKDENKKWEKRRVPDFLTKLIIRKVHSPRESKCLLGERIGCYKTQVMLIMNKIFDSTIIGYAKGEM